MADSVYKVIELVGTSPTSWEEAARSAIEKADAHVQDLRVTAPPVFARLGCGYIDADHDVLSTLRSKPRSGGEVRQHV